MTKTPDAKTWRDTALMLAADNVAMADALARIAQDDPSEVARYGVAWRQILAKEAARGRVPVVSDRE
jgi:hypothetical protein